MRRTTDRMASTCSPRDTRLISAWAIYANGDPWDLLNGGGVTNDTARIFLTNRGFLTEAPAYKDVVRGK